MVFSPCTVSICDFLLESTFGFSNIGGVDFSCVFDVLLLSWPREDAEIVEIERRSLNLGSISGEVSKLPFRTSMLRNCYID